MHEKGIVMKTKDISIFKDMAGIEYFRFEEDFVGKNIRCIPMIVRFKMDKAGIKLKLSDWAKFSTPEKIELVMKPCSNAEEVKLYNSYLARLIKSYTGKEPTCLIIDQHPGWEDKENIPDMLQDKLKECGWTISIAQWNGLTNLQRFALLKLCKPGHENKNFSKAMDEFSLVAIKQIPI